MGTEKEVLPPLVASTGHEELVRSQQVKRPAPFTVGWVLGEYFANEEVKVTMEVVNGKLREF